MPYLLLGLTVFTHPKPLGCIPRSTERRGWPQYHIIQTTQKARTALATVLAGCFLMDSWPCWLFVYWMYSRSYQKWSDLTLNSNLNVAFLHLTCGCFVRVTLVYQTLPSCLWLRNVHLRLHSCSPTQNRWLGHSCFFSETSVVAEQRKGEIMLLNIT